MKYKIQDLKYTLQIIKYEIDNGLLAQAWVSLQIQSVLRARSYMNMYIYMAFDQAIVSLKRR